tara:strand:+ start:282 stop:1676 length:1395 start_codon:yes stop_codon:yes gene_type:complete
MKKIILLFLLTLFCITNVYSEITYLQILKDPTDLRLNLQYAKEQEGKGEYKSVTATLERLTSLYPKNIDLKLYLLSMSIKTDSTEKTLNLIKEIQSSDQISEEIKKQVAQVFDDMNKKKIDTDAVDKKKAREETQLAAADNKQAPTESINPWTWYTEFGYTNVLHSNIGNATESGKTVSAGNDVAQVNIAEGDHVTSLRNTYGAIYQIDPSSNLSLSTGHTTSEQSKGTSDESDTQSFSATYSKFLERNSITSTFSFTDANARRAADSFSKNLSLDNRFALTDKHKLLTGINIGRTHGDQNGSNQTKRASNTWKQGFVFGHEYFFTPQHNVKLKYAYTDTHAIANFNALEDQTVTASYGNNFKIGNLGFTYSESNKAYEEPDRALVHSKGRRDKAKTKTISFSGNLNQVFSAQEFIPIPKTIGKFLNTLNYNTSWSETQSEGTLLQQNFKKESFTFGLTKRLYF